MPKTKNDKVILYGYAVAIMGNKIWVDIGEEIIIIPIKSRQKIWDLYCNDLKITIEVIDKDQNG